MIHTVYYFWKVLVWGSYGFWFLRPYKVYCRMRVMSDIRFIVFYWGEWFRMSSPVKIQASNELFESGYHDTMKELRKMLKSI